MFVGDINEVVVTFISTQYGFVTTLRYSGRLWSTKHYARASVSDRGIEPEAVIGRHSSDAGGR